MIAGLNPAHVGERRHQANGPVTAHAKVADIVKKDDPRNTGRYRLNQQRPHHDVRSTRLIHDGGTKAIVFIAENVEPLGNGGPAPRFGPPDMTARVGSPPVWESMIPILWTVEGIGVPFGDRRSEVRSQRSEVRDQAHSLRLADL